MSDSASPNTLERFYVHLLGFLALLAALFTVKELAFPRWPHARSLNQAAIEDSLNNSGIKFRFIGNIPHKRSFEVATSSGLHYELEDDYTLILFNGATRQRFNFQVAFLGRTYAETSLTGRYLVDNPPAAIGNVNGQSTIQTCLVQDPTLINSRVGVTRIQLGLLADKRSNYTAYSASQVIGITPNRSYSCTFMSLSRPKQGGEVSQEQLLRVVKSLRSAKVVQ